MLTPKAGVASAKLPLQLKQLCESCLRFEAALALET